MNMEKNIITDNLENLSIKNECYNFDIDMLETELNLIESNITNLKHKDNQKYVNIWIIAPEEMIIPDDDDDDYPTIGDYYYDETVDSYQTIYVQIYRDSTDCNVSMSRKYGQLPYKNIKKLARFKRSLNYIKTFDGEKCYITTLHDIYNGLRC